MPENQSKHGCEWHSGIEARMTAAEKSLEKIWKKIDWATNASFVAMGAVLIQLFIMVKESWR